MIVKNAVSFFRSGLWVFLLFLLSNDLLAGKIRVSRQYNVWTTPSNPVLLIENLHRGILGATFHTQATFLIELANNLQSLTITHQPPANNPGSGWQELNIRTTQLYRMRIDRQTCSVPFNDERYYVGSLTVQQMLVHTNSEIQTCLKDQAPGLFMFLDQANGNGDLVNSIHVITDTHVPMQLPNETWVQVPATIYQFWDMNSEPDSNGSLTGNLLAEFAMGNSAGLENVLLIFHHLLPDHGTDLWYTLTPDELYNRWYNLKITRLTEAPEPDPRNRGEHKPVIPDRAKIWTPRLADRFKLQSTKADSVVDVYYRSLIRFFVIGA